MNTRLMIKQSYVPAVIAAVLVQAQLGPNDSQKTNASPALQFNYMGPPAGGRIASTAGVPGDNSIVYLGVASGGRFMTAAALLQYPTFYTAGWSESGNHDNHSHNHGWSDKYNGVRQGNTDSKVI